MWLHYNYITDTNTSPLILKELIINNKVVPVEITEALAEKPLGIKGLNIFLKKMGVGYIDLLITKIFEMVHTPKTAGKV